MSVSSIVIICIDALLFLGLLSFAITRQALVNHKQKLVRKQYAKEERTLQPSKEVLEQPKNPSTTDGEVSALKLVNIVKVYGKGENKVSALKNVSMDFRKSEFVSILGPSGCGKTTMLNIIGGLDRYTSGDLIINGKSTKNFADRDWDAYRNNSVGFVFQSYNLIPHQTVLGNVELALTISGVSKGERRRRAKAVLEKVGLKGQANKLPNQLSGGQMQRVAIARALVNDPEIILADEPTGALDTETSIQVLNLLQEVAKDRLVIMVTHNPSLAKKYSTRIINLLDGEKKGDTNPFVSNSKKMAKSEKKHTKMSIFTAFSLSFSNLRTKKARTILTSVAGSIGIIGIALVLALSTGFSNYIGKLQSDTLSVYPLTISESTIDLTDFNQLTEGTGLEKFPKLKEVYTREMFGKLTNMLKSNKITSEYIEYITDYVDEKNEAASKTDEKWNYCLQEDYGFDMNNYIFSNIGVNMSILGNPVSISGVMPVDSLVNYLEDMFNTGLQSSQFSISADFVRTYIPTMDELPDNYTLLDSQYDVLQGEWAKNEDELVLVVDSRNQVSDITLALLGYRTIDGIDLSTYSVQFGGDDTMSFDDAMSKVFYYVDNDTRYTANADGSYNDSFYAESAVPSNATTLKITGIVRIKEGVEQGVLSTGIAYTAKLKNKVLADNKTSAIVAAANSTEEKAVTVNTVFNQYHLGTGKTLAVKELAGSDTISKLSIYSVGYEAKETIKDYLDAWNDKEGRLEEDKVFYSDSTEMLFSALNSIVEAVKIVLIAFTSISLVVSSIMIGIITYVSVVERTKEIGVLRSIGARKKDISRIFNAETFLIGLFAGLIGVIITYILTIPINIIIGSFLTGVGNLASLPITNALLLVAISFVLTLIAGLIPANIAAKKDPVVALRTE